MKKIELVSSFNARSYQQSIFANSINKNTLCVLPTGLGKTIIAIMLCVYYFNKTNKKVLFLAPTKPLVEQQMVSFKSFFLNSDDFSFQVLTGLVSPNKRKELYVNADFLFSTPQLIENDIVNKIINPDDFCFVIVDEAHRATGNYAYCFTAEEFDKYGVRILALTASPGTSKEQIREVMDNLRVQNIQIKKYEDPDVKEYTKNVKIEYVKVKLTDDMLKIKQLLDTVVVSKINKLKDLSFFEGKLNSQISKKDLLDLQVYLRDMISKGEADEDIWKAISISAGLMKLQYGIELFESQEISAAHNYFYNFFRQGGDRTKAAEELTYDIDFRHAYEMITKLKNNGIIHPKLIELKKIVNEEISKNSDLKIIIFNQYRDSAQKLVLELEKIKEIKPALFVGQSKKGDVSMSQKKQKEILEEFRKGKYNILISTSVGEEGLDIPKVDLVIFYEPVPSAIRTIQRVGRTGRFNEGKAYVLMSEGTRDVTIRYVASAKEKKMYKALDDIKKEIEKNGVLGSESEQTKGGLGLNKFIEMKNENMEKVEIKGEDSRVTILVDNRENNDLLKELHREDEINAKMEKLEIGDIIITQDIAIERKSKKDFVNSIIDKRLFPQLINLAKNFRRPLLILEGDENIYSIRNVNPNVIRATISAITVDLRIPIIYTNSITDTKEMILTIARRTQKTKKDISLAGSKMSATENEEIEKVLSSVPKINVVIAKQLLAKFKTLKKVANANEKQLLSIEGVGNLRAKYIKDFFEREYKFD